MTLEVWTREQGKIHYKTRSTAALAGRRRHNVDHNMSELQIKIQIEWSMLYVKKVGSEQLCCSLEFLRHPWGAIEALHGLLSEVTWAFAGSFRFEPLLALLKHFFAAIWFFVCTACGCRWPTWTAFLTIICLHVQVFWERCQKRIHGSLPSQLLM